MNARMTNNNHLDLAAAGSIATLLFRFFTKIRNCTQHRIVYSGGLRLRVTTVLIRGTCRFEFGRRIKLAIKPVCKSVVSVDGVQVGMDERGWRVGEGPLL